MKNDNLFEVIVERHDEEQGESVRENITVDMFDLARSIGCGDDEIAAYFSDFQLDTVTAQPFSVAGRAYVWGRKEELTFSFFNASVVDGVYRFERGRRADNVEIEITFTGTNEDGEKADHSVIKRTTFRY